jgi:hypothetical protein
MFFCRRLNSISGLYLVSRSGRENYYRQEKFFGHLFEQSSKQNGSQNCAKRRWAEAELRNATVERCSLSLVLNPAREPSQNWTGDWWNSGRRLDRDPPVLKHGMLMANRCAAWAGYEHQPRKAGGLAAPGFVTRCDQIR